MQSNSNCERLNELTFFTNKTKLDKIQVNYLITNHDYVNPQSDFQKSLSLQSFAQKNRAFINNGLIC